MHRCNDIIIAITRVGEARQHPHIVRPGGECSEEGNTKQDAKKVGLSAPLYALRCDFAATFRRLCNCGLRFSMSRAALRSAICNFTGLLEFFT